MVSQWSYIGFADRGAPLHGHWLNITGRGAINFLLVKVLQVLLLCFHLTVLHKYVVNSNIKMFDMIDHNDLMSMIDQNELMIFFKHYPSICR